MFTNLIVLENTHVTLWTYLIGGIGDGDGLVPEGEGVEEKKEEKRKISKRGGNHLRKRRRFLTDVF